MMGHILSLAFLARMVRSAVPLVLAALGGSITERSGLVDLALEAKLLFGAFVAACVGHATDSAVLGIVAAMGVGMLIAGIQAFFALVLEADQVIVGVALNAIALGGTRFLLQLIYGEGANSPPFDGLGEAVLGNPLVWLAAIAAITVPLAVVRTRWGLRLRATGDRPESLVAVAVSPIKARFAAALVGGALAGAGGAQLSLSVNGFSAEMSGGRGYIALAMVILAGWRPGIAALACLGMALAATLAIELEIAGVGIPGDLVQLLPYVLTLVVLVIAGGRPPPQALGKA